MKKFYDFSKGRRGALVAVPPGKTRITIRLDNEILDWFRDKVDARGGGSYQTMINSALREYIERRQENLEEKIRQAMLDALSVNMIFIETTTNQVLTARSQDIRRDISPFNAVPLEVAQSGIAGYSLTQH
jgi:hypothetical protein